MHCKARYVNGFPWTCTQLIKIHLVMVLKAGTYQAGKGSGSVSSAILFEYFFEDLAIRR